MKKKKIEISTEFKAFITVAETKSFTQSAAILGITQSRLSQTIKELEARLGVRLFNRTTRSVNTTEEGEKLHTSLSPLFNKMDTAIDEVMSMSGKVAGKVRISATEAGVSALWPCIRSVMEAHPDIEVETVIDYGLVDIVEQGFDAGIRSGTSIPNDMVAIPLSPPIRTAVVASPAYVAKYGKPSIPEDLLAHTCINIRLPTHGGVYRWEFEREGQQLFVDTPQSVITTSAASNLSAALNGLGYCYLPDQSVQAFIDTGLLVRVLEEWCDPYPGYYLYYPGRELQRPALKTLIDGIKATCVTSQPEMS